ncbi:MAG: tetratricopeptide repeat protein [Flavobacteriales bacterium]|nr:tetratricopeptide repeat protein [Flavobacteriales bacterium]
MRKLFLILSFVFTASFLLANNPLFEQANKLYAEEEYKQAIVLYDSIQQKELQSEELFYNMGNAYYKLQNWAESIFYYEKTLKLNSNNEDALHNLELAQLKIADNIEAIPSLFFEKWISSIISFLKMDYWAILCVFLLWLSFFVFGIKNLSNFQLPNYLLIALLILSFNTLFFANKQYHEKIKQKPAIIFSSAVVIKSAPSFNANDLFSLHSGSKIIITDQIGEWVQIRIANGNKGWMLKNNCKEI